MQSPASGAHASAKRSTLIKLRATLQMNVTGRFLWGFSCRPQTKPIIKICSHESVGQECKEPQVGSPQESPFNLRLSQGASRLPWRTQLFFFPCLWLAGIGDGKRLLPTGRRTVVWMLAEGDRVPASPTLEPAS